MENKSKFKKLLATASAFAMIAGASSSAMGAQRTTNANNAVIGGANTGLNAGFINGDNVLIGNALHTNITTGADITFGAANGGLDEGGTGGAIVFTIAHDVTFAHAAVFGGNNGGITSMIVNAGNSNFGGDVDSSVRVNGGQITIAGNITAAGLSTGDLVVTGGTVNNVGDIANDATISGGAVTAMGDVNNDLKVSGGTVTAVGTVGQDVKVSGGTVAAMGNVTRNVAVSGDGKIGNAGARVAGTVGGTLSVTGNALYYGNGAITGVTTIDTTNAGTSELGDTRAVNVVRGNLAMGDVTNAGSDLTLGANAGNVSVGTVVRNVNVQGGHLTAMGNVTGNVAVSGNGKIGDVGGRVAGTVGGTLGVTGNALYYGNGAITGVTTIDTTNAGTSELNVVANTVTVNKGNLTMGNVTGGGHDLVLGANAGNVSVGTVVRNVNVQGGHLTAMGNVAGNVAVSGNGKIGTDAAPVAGTVTGTLGVTGNGLYVGAGNVTAAVTINTANAGTNKIGAAGNAVTVTQGKLEMTNQNNGGGANVRIDGGELVIGNILDAGSDLLVNGGTVQAGTVGHDLVATGGVVTSVGNVANDVTLTNGAKVTSAGNVDNDLNVGDAALFVGNNTDVDGVVTIHTTNAEDNIIHNADDNVTVTEGILRGNDITGAHDLLVSGANAKAFFNSANQNVDVNNGGKAVIEGNIGGAIGDASGNGTVTLGAGTTTGRVGNGAAIDNMVITGNRTFANAGWRVTNLKANGDVTVTYTDAGADLGGTNVTTDEEEGKPNFHVAGDQTITGEWGTAENPLGNLHDTTAGGKDITIQTKKFFAGITGATEDKTDVIMDIDGARVRSIGSNDIRMLSTTFQNNGRVDDGVNSKATTVDAGMVATLGGVIKGGDIELANVGSHVRFLEGADLRNKVVAGVANQGEVFFENGGIMGGDLGADGQRILHAHFEGDRALDANGNVHSVNTTFAGKFDLKQNVKLDTVTNTINNGAEFDLGGYTATTILGSTTTFNGDTKVAFTLQNQGNDLTGGHFVINNGGNIRFADGATVEFTPDDRNATPVAGQSRQFTVLDNNGVALVAGDTLADAAIKFGKSLNPFTKWTGTMNAQGDIVLTQTDIAAKAVIDKLGKKADAADKHNIDVIMGAANDTDGGKVRDLLRKVFDNKEIVDETVDRFTPVTTVSDIVEEVIITENRNMAERMITLAGVQRTGTPTESRLVANESNTRISGVSAGDQHNRFGAWFSPFYDSTTQKARKGAAGYKSEGYGASFGIDTKANDDLIIGAAVTFAHTDMKHKNFKSGDKTKVDTKLFSIYAMTQLTDAWFAHGTATFGTNDVKNNEKRVKGIGANGNAIYDRVSGKYSSMSFAIDSMFGYNYVTEQVTLTPMAGIRYTRVNDGGYKESGSTTGQNFDVNTKASNRLDIVAGLRASAPTFDLNGAGVTPEIHAFINHDLIGKNGKRTIKVNGGNNNMMDKSRKPVRTTYNVGVGVGAEMGMMEYRAGYDLTLGDKRTGHQGTLSVRVNF